MAMALKFCRLVAPTRCEGRDCHLLICRADYLQRLDRPVSDYACFQKIGLNPVKSVGADRHAADAGIIVSVSEQVLPGGSGRLHTGQGGRIQQRIGIVLGPGHRDPGKCFLNQGQKLGVHTQPPHTNPQ